jgi:Arc/MetJ-type ribon-helix-helix transcriptional regulator
MKLSVSLPDDDVAALDEHARRTGLSSRSAAIHDAVRLLRTTGLEDDYAAAWNEWDTSGERDVWDVATGDGLL